MFLIGGINGAFSAAVPVDFALQDTYWVVAHLHYVLFGGSVFGVMAGLYYWFPKMTGRMLNEGLGKVQFVLMFIGFNLTFFPMHQLGLAGMPRRIADYASERRLERPEPRSRPIGGFMIAASMIPLLWNVFISLRGGQDRRRRPVGGATRSSGRRARRRRRTTSTTCPRSAPSGRCSTSATAGRRATDDASTPARSSRPATRVTPSPSTARSAGSPTTRRGGISNPILGMILFICSEVMFFSGLFAAYFSVRASRRPVAADHRQRPGAHRALQPPRRAVVRGRA